MRLPDLLVSATLTACTSARVSDLSDSVCGFEGRVITAMDPEYEDAEAVWDALVGQHVVPTEWTSVVQEQGGTATVRSVDTLLDWQPLEDPYVSKSNFACVSGAFVMVPYTVVIHTADDGISDTVVATVQIDADVLEVGTGVPVGGTGTAALSADWLADTPPLPSGSSLEGYRTSVSGDPFAPRFGVKADLSDADSRSLYGLWEGRAL